MRTPWFPIAILLLCLIRLDVQAAEDETLHLCQQITSFADRDILMVKKGLFKNAFRAAKRGQWEKSDRLMRNAKVTLEKEVRTLFHPPTGTETDNEAIQRFLEKTVYGPSPGLTIGEDNFHVRAEVTLTHAHVLCQMGSFAQASALLAEDPEENHPDQAQAQAVTHLLQGDFAGAESVLAQLKPSFSKELLQAALLIRQNNQEKAFQATGRLLETCVGSKQCSWARQLRAQLEGSTSP